MSNPQLNSADSSAVVATIRESTTISPWTYNEKHRLVSPHSMNLLNVPTSSGTVGASKTFSFDVPKQGLAQGFYLNFTMPAFAVTTTQTVDDNLDQTLDDAISGAGNTSGFFATGILQCIREIKMETSGRVLEQLSRWQMLARYSDLPAGKKKAVQESLRMIRDPDSSAYQCVMWLPFFGWREPERYAYNTSFCEPLRIIVSLDDCACLHKLSGSTNSVEVHAPTSAELMVHYRQLAPADEDSLISANYGDGLLSRILSLSREEAVTTDTPTSTNAKEVTVELKESDCVSAIYVIVECPDSHAENTAYHTVLKGKGIPLEVTKMALKFNGQEVISCPGSFLQYYGRWGEENGEGCGSGNAELTWRHVYKIDFSLGYKAGGAGGGGNTVALREISSPRIVLTYLPAAADKAHNIHVIYESTTFESTSSATGRVQLSISS